MPRDLKDLANEINRGAITLGETNDEYVDFGDNNHTHPVFVLDNGADQRFADTDLGADSDGPFLTDFEHRMQQEETAYQGPDGQRLDEIDQKVVLRQMQKKEASAESPHACANPASWDRGILGNSVLVQPNQATSVESLTVPLIYWPGDEREGLPVMVSINPEALPTPAASTGVFRPFARIRFGNRADLAVDVDIGTGIVLALSGSSVYVDVGLDGGSDTAMQISGSLAYWATSAPTPNTRTSYVGTVVHAQTSVAFNRPRYAKQITAVDRVNATVPFTVNLLDANNNIIAARSLTAAQADAGNSLWLGLPNDCAAVSIKNDDGANDTAFRVVWGLSF